MPEATLSVRQLLDMDDFPAESILRVGLPEAELKALRTQVSGALQGMSWSDLESVIGEKFSEALDIDPITLLAAAWKKYSLLADDPDGFFLLIENEGIDTASHNHHSGDVARALTEYDEALRVALDFAAARRDTLVIAVGDHETGGLDICCEGGDEKGWRMEWSTPDHTGAAIPLFAFGPGSQSFAGYIDNTDVGRKLLSFVRK